MYPFSYRSYNTCFTISIWITYENNSLSINHRRLNRIASPSCWVILFKTFLFEVYQESLNHNKISIFVYFMNWVIQDLGQKVKGERKSQSEKSSIMAVLPHDLKCTPLSWVFKVLHNCLLYTSPSPRDS